MEVARACALRGDWAGVETSLASTRYGDELMFGRFALWRRIVPPHLPQLSNYARVCNDVARDGALGVEQRAFIHARAAKASGRLGALSYQRNAEIFSFVGEVDDAFDAVRSSVDSGLIDFAWMEHCPPLASLRQDTRWGPLRAVVERRASDVRAAIAGS